MRARLAQRQIALACVALLAAAVSLALTTREHRRARALPPAHGSYTALAGSSGAAAFGKHTACGQVIGPGTEGVAHPVLPCGVRLYVVYKGTRVLTEVIDRGPYVRGREFQLTEALARRLGLSGVAVIRWSYAGRR
jgi:peptidoglycan lytic transglycosylase